MSAEFQAESEAESETESSNPPERTPLANFMGFIVRWTQGVDGIAQIIIKIPMKEKYKAFPMTDRQGHIVEFDVYVPFGAKPDPNEAERKRALDRIMEGLPIAGRMGGGEGEDENTNTEKQGFNESTVIKKQVVRKPHGKNEGGVVVIRRK